MMDDFDGKFLLVWVLILIANFAFWAGLIALGFYAVNKFA